MAGPKGQFLVEVFDTSEVLLVNVKHLSNSKLPLWMGDLKRNWDEILAASDMKELAPLSVQLTILIRAMG